jgi:uncharacterized membrane protein HdeD (DUF308 family)
MDAKATSSAGAASGDARMDHPAWMLMLRGAIAILFGVLAMLWPGLTLIALVALFAAYALLSGAVSIAAAFKIRHADRKWWLPLLLGVISVVAGVYAVMAPSLTALVLVLVMGVNAILTGALDIAMAVRLRKVLRGQWLLLLGGVVSVLFGVLVIANPGAGALALVWLISVYAIVTGVLLFSLGLRTWRAARSDPFHHGLAGGH